MTRGLDDRGKPGFSRAMTAPFPAPRRTRHPILLAAAWLVGLSLLLGAPRLQAFEGPVPSASSPATPTIEAPGRTAGPRLPPPDFPVVAVPPGKVWPWEGSDVALDPAVKTGRLPNGMRYALRVNVVPREAVSLRLRMDVGSLHERPDQRGFAHLLEHMAFNGSTNVAEGGMVAILERLGARFGVDVNAHVTARETQFKLDIPRAADGRLTQALALLRETADRLSLDQAAIDREKGVVISEMRAADGPAARLGKAQAEWLLPEDGPTLKDPLGSRAVVEGATTATLRAFYEDWYRPERALLVIVGDIDVEATEAAIRAAFADWAPATPTTPAEPDDGRWPAPVLRALVQTHPDLPPSLRVTTTIGDEIDYGDADLKSRREWWTMNEIGAEVMRRRLTTLQLQDDPPFINVSFSQNGTKNGWSAGFGVSPRGNDWRRAMKAVAIELRQALAQGFNAEEIAEAVKELRLGRDRAVAEAATRRTGALAAGLLSTLAGGGVPTTPETRKALFEEAAARATPERINAAFAWWWQGVEPALVLVDKQPPDGDSETMKAAWAEAMAAPLPARAPYRRARFEPVPPGPPGKVTGERHDPRADFTTVTFENGVVLRHKATTHARDRASIAVTLGAGGLSFAPEIASWTLFANSAWNADGVGEVTRDQMITALAGRSTELAAAGVSLDRTSLFASPATGDVREQMQVMLAQIVSPRLGPFGTLMLREYMAKGWPVLRLSAAGAFSFHAGTLFQTGSPMFDMPTLEALLAVPDATANANLRAILANAPVAVTVVGDVPLEAARAAVAETFAALPPRAGMDRGFAQLANWRTAPTGGPPRVLRHGGPKEQAIVHVSWMTPGGRDVRRSRALWALGEVLQLRLTAAVREAEGKSYSPSGGWGVVSEQVDLGRVHAHAQVAPADVPKVEAIIHRIAKDLAAAGPTQDELDRVRGPALEARARARQTNAHWVAAIVDEGLDRPPAAGQVRLLARDRTFERDLNGLRPADLKRLARRHLVDAAAIRVHVLPDPEPATAPTPSPAVEPTPAPTS
jgi:zinc protease